MLSHEPEAADIANKNNKYPVDLATSKKIIDLMPYKKKNKSTVMLHILNKN